MHDHHDAGRAHHPDRVAQLQGSTQCQSSARTSKEKQTVNVKQTSSKSERERVGSGALQAQQVLYIYRGCSAQGLTL